MRRLTNAEAVNALSDIVKEFEDRPWHKNVKCRWDGRLLWLEADNDYDANGEALFDEFWDVIAAYITSRGTVHLEIVSVEAVPDGK